MKKSAFFVLCLTLYSAMAFAGREKYSVLDIGIVDEGDRVTVTMERLPHYYAHNDKNFRSKNETDLKVVVYDKAGKSIEFFYLKWFKDPSIGLGGSTDPKTGKPPFTRFKRYSSLTFKIKSSAHKVEIFLDKKTIESKLVNTIVKIEP